MAQPTSGMALQMEHTTNALASMHGDLIAIQFLLETSKRSDVGFDARKHLWNARSRLITRVVQSLGITNVNSLESSLARELVVMGSKQV